MSDSLAKSKLYSKITDRGMELQNISIKIYETPVPGGTLYTTVSGNYEYGSRAHNVSTVFVPARQEGDPKVTINYDYNGMQVQEDGNSIQITGKETINPGLIIPRDIVRAAPDKISWSEQHVITPSKHNSGSPDRNNLSYDDVSALLSWSRKVNRPVLESYCFVLLNRLVRPIGETKEKNTQLMWHIANQITQEDLDAAHELWNRPAEA